MTVSLTVYETVACQDHLDTVFNKGQDVSLCESIHRPNNCFRS